MPVRTLHTAGYEGESIDGFVARMQAHGVRCVVDVREAPISRKPGFSKRALAERLGQAGIEYRHVPALGCPKPIRDRHRADGDWARYTRDFLSHLRRQSESVAALRDLALATPCVLICYEADFNACHRTYVARAVQAAGGPAVVHLTTAAAMADRSLPAAACLA